MKRAAAIDDDAQLWRQYEVCVRDRRAQLSCKRSRVDQRRWVIGQWIAQDWHAKRRDIQGRNLIGKAWCARGGQAAHLQAATCGNFDGAVAVPLRRCAERGEYRRSNAFGR